LPIIIVEPYAVDLNEDGVVLLEYSPDCTWALGIDLRRLKHFHASVPVMEAKATEAVTASGRHERVEIDEILTNGDSKTPV
jgi:hypothetical protein